MEKSNNPVFYYKEEIEPTIKKEHADWSVKDINLEVMKKWRSLEKTEKEKYYKKAEEATGSPLKRITDAPPKKPTVTAAPSPAGKLSSIGKKVTTGWSKGKTTSGTGFSTIKWNVKPSGFKNIDDSSDSNDEGDGTSLRTFNLKFASERKRDSKGRNFNASSDEDDKSEEDSFEECEEDPEEMQSIIDQLTSVYTQMMYSYTQLMRMFPSTQTFYPQLMNIYSQMQNMYSYPQVAAMQSQLSYLYSQFMNANSQMVGMQHQMVVMQQQIMIMQNYLSKMMQYRSMPQRSVYPPMMPQQFAQQEQMMREPKHRHSKHHHHHHHHHH